jgi:hypothetical protein
MSSSEVDEPEESQPMELDLTVTEGQDEPQPTELAVASTTTEQKTDYLLICVHHITMPSELPQVALSLDDERTVNSRMCDLVRRAASVYARTQRGKKVSLWNSIAKTFKTMAALASGALEPDKVESVLKSLSKGGEIHRSDTEPPQHYTAKILWPFT